MAVSGLCIFFVVPLVDLLYGIVAFLGYTHLLFNLMGTIPDVNVLLIICKQTNCFLSFRIQGEDLAPVNAFKHPHR